MALEHEIQQEKFQSNQQKAVINVLVTGSWLHSKSASNLKPFGITPEQYNVLRILRGSSPNPLRLADIACRMIDKSSNATRLVEKLRQKNLVDRQLCESDRRQVDIKITRQGLELLKQIDARDGQWQDVQQRLTDDEAMELNRLLDKLREPK